MSIDEPQNEAVEFTTVVINGRTFVLTADGRRLPVPCGGSDGEETEGDAGGVGDADASNAADGEQDGDDTDSADEADGEANRDASEKGDKGNAGLQKRLKAVIAQRNKYRELGTPEELAALKAKVAEYDRYEKKIEEEEQAAADEKARKEGRPTVAEQNAALDRMLNQRFGDGAVEDFMDFRETRKREIARHTRDGIEHLRALLDGVGLKTDDTTVESYERHVGTELMRDPELRTRFRDPVTQKDALAEAFKRVRAGLIDPALAAVGAEKLGRHKARRETVLGNAGSGGNPQLDEFENLTPPKGLNPDQRRAWWEKKMNSAADAMDW